MDVYSVSDSIELRRGRAKSGATGPASIPLDLIAALAYEDYDDPTANLVARIKTLLQRQVPTSYNVGALLQPHLLARTSG